MLAIALKAQVPIIRATTSDVLNVQRVLEHLADGKKVALWNGYGDTFKKNDVLYAIDEVTHNSGTYDQMVSEEKTLVLLNQAQDSYFALNVGEVPVPEDLLRGDLQTLMHLDQVELLLPCFKGLTLKTSIELVRLASAAFGDLTVRNLTTMRGQLTGSLRGLNQVDTHLPVYLPPLEVKQWLQVNKKFFLEPKIAELVPRGLLFNGLPGVGKDFAAKFIATELGVPLYRMDLSGSLSKWQGESEAQLSRVLATIDQEEPCCLLISETEKVFSSSHEGDVTTRLLSQLLWWLAEHKSRVLTIMTTNKMEALPPELYRPGRVNRVFTLRPLNWEEGAELGHQVYKNLGGKKWSAQKALKFSGMYDTEKSTATPAEIVDAAQEYFKAHP